MGSVGSRIRRKHASPSRDVGDAQQPEYFALKRVYDKMAMLSPRDKFVDRATFVQYFPLEGVLAKRLFIVFDTKKTGYIDREEFLNGLALCLHGTREEKYQMIFDMCNLDGSDGISPEELSTVLFSSVSASYKILHEIYKDSAGDSDMLEDVQKQVRHVVEQAFEEYDRNKTGKLSPSDFRLWLQQNPLLVDSIFGHESFRHHSGQSPSPSPVSKSKRLTPRSQVWMDNKPFQQKMLFVDGAEPLKLSSHKSAPVLTWEKVGLTDAMEVSWPQQRDRHAVCCYDGLFYLVGGRNGGVSYSDFWSWNPKTRAWRVLPGNLPLLQGHTAVTIRNMLVVFGGQFPMDLHCCLCIYNFDTEKWHVNESRQSTLNTSSLQMWQKPTNRSFHVAVVYQENMYIHGGIIDLKGITNELWQFSQETLAWQKLQNRSDRSPYLCYHSALVHQDAVWIHGGTSPSGVSSDTWQLSLETLKWKRVHSVCPAPALYSHTANKVGKHMVVMGGKTRTDWNYSVWLFDFDTYTWATVDMVSSDISPFPVMDHTVVISLLDMKDYPLPPVSAVRVTAEGTLPESTVFSTGNEMDSKSNASTVSVNDCDVELADLASIVLPGSVSEEQTFDELKSLKIFAVEKLPGQERTASGHLKAVVPGEASAGSSLCSKYSVEMYLLGGRLGSSGTSLRQLTLWHCCMTNT